MGFCAGTAGISGTLQSCMAAGENLTGDNDPPVSADELYRNITANQMLYKALQGHDLCRDAAWRRQPESPVSLLLNGAGCAA